MATFFSKAAGALLLVGATQFIIFLVIAETVYPDYSVSHNYISDLGVWGKPSAPFFNVSTMIFGLCVIAGAYFIHREFDSRVIAALFGAAGLGALGVGIFPENTFVVHGIPIIHTISAGTGFVVGGIAAIASFKFSKPPMRYISVVLGAAALVAAVLFRATKDSNYLGLGVGGMERMVAYPTLLFLMGFGGYLLALHSNR